MKRIEEYLPKEEDNDRMIQKALREIDHETLINLCTHLGSKAELLYRNLSKRVYELAKTDVEERKKSIPEFRQKAAYALFQRKLLKYERKRVVEDNEMMNSLCFDTQDEIHRSLGYIYKLNKNQDIEKMDSLVEGIENPHIRKSLEAVLYADDPLEGEVRIERMIALEVEKTKKRMELLKRGILSILSGDPAEIFFEKLND